MGDRKLLKKKYMATQRLRRDIERSSMESLQLDVNALKQQIADLQSMRALLIEKTLIIQQNQSAMRLAVVDQYAKMTAFGIGDERRDAWITRRMKEDFMRSITSPTFVFGELSDVDGMLEQLRLYKALHGYYRNNTIHAEELPYNQDDETVVVLIRMETHVRVSRTTIESIFPHLLGNEVLVQQLLGRTLVYPSEARMHFDAHGKNARLSVVVDFVVGMNNSLHSLPVVADILNGAMFEDGFAIVAGSASRAR